MDQTVSYVGEVTDLNPNIAAESRAFTLRNIPRHAEMCDMFDSYRINGVTCTWAFQTNVPSQVAQASFTMLTRLDYDGDTLVAPATAVTMMGSGTTKYHQVGPNRLNVRRKFSPKPLTIMYTGSIIPGQVGYRRSSNKPWIGTVSPDVFHYGIDFAFTTALGSQTFVNPVGYEFRVTYHLEFKEVIDRVP